MATGKAPSGKKILLFRIGVLEIVCAIIILFINGPNLDHHFFIGVGAILMGIFFIAKSKGWDDRKKIKFF
jgi:hypothetical protein